MKAVSEWARGRDREGLYIVIENKDISSIFKTKYSLIKVYCILAIVHTHFSFNNACNSNFKTTSQTKVKANWWVNPARARPKSNYLLKAYPLQKISNLSTYFFWALLNPSLSQVSSAVLFSKTLASLIRFLKLNELLVNELEQNLTEERGSKAFIGR